MAWQKRKYMICISLQYNSRWFISKWKFWRKPAQSYFEHVDITINRTLDLIVIVYSAQKKDQKYLQINWIIRYIKAKDIPIAMFATPKITILFLLKFLV